ncbi:hypothetical protein [Streptomyces radicis]|uniref:DUF3618 domain-containing protein n=1 Tax=Streptomyces radicis TaxID=1750517 RepID=A0A3A9WLY8_9ACTN|nr:hypothetical protein [Streptomyces radicis]RKN10484.1 hypothetical protein D7319_08610 [Streptomyces radicis]RKN24743.1 hypothetical protein D7318_09785 [Streptomyces radicis]
MTQAARSGTERARRTADEARGQARAAATELRGRFAAEADAQARGVAGAVRRWADDIAGLAENAPGDSPARGLAAQAADTGHRAADQLDQRGVDGLMDELRDFARRRPAAFIGGAALAGFAVGRLVRAGRAASADAPGAAGRDDGAEPEGVERPEV